MSHLAYLAAVVLAAVGLIVLLTGGSAAIALAHRRLGDDHPLAAGR